jgi:hypothetical protein
MMQPPPQGPMMPPPPQGPMMPPPPMMMQPPPQGPMMQQPQGPMMMPPQGPMPQPGMPGYQGWNGPPQQPPHGPSPSMEMFDPRPVYAQRPSMPGMGFPPRRRQALKPWMLVVGALVMAALAFVITRAFLS